MALFFRQRTLSSLSQLQCPRRSPRLPSCDYAGSRKCSFQASFDTLGTALGGSCMCRQRHTVASAVLAASACAPGACASCVTCVASVCAISARSWTWRACRSVRSATALCACASSASKRSWSRCAALRCFSPSVTSRGSSRLVSCCKVPRRV